MSLSLRARSVALGTPARRMRRPSLSAGALHPIHAVLLRGNQRPVALHYDHASNGLARISTLSFRRAQAAIDACRVVLPEARGDFIFLLAEPDKTAAHYNEPASLLWRDAGAVIQVLAMTAAALELAFCPLGILGSEIVSAIGADPEQVQPVGVCAVGRSIQSSAS